MKNMVSIFLVSIGIGVCLAATAQTAAADNKVQESITFRQMPKGPDLYGIFEGRSTCEIAKQFGATFSSPCDHLKWQLILYRDPSTQQPTTFTLSTEMFDRRPLEGKWKIVRGAKHDPSATVYELNYAANKSLYLLKGDENVLFILDEDREFYTGNQDFSYTLNRVELVPAKN